MHDRDARGDKEEPKAQDDKPAAPWQFKPENEPTHQEKAASEPTSVGAVSWTASEFIAHDKAPSWYAGLAAAAFLLAVAIYFLAHDWISIVVIIIITAIFGVFAGRKPRVLNYELDQSGLHIADKFYPYADFKSFSVMEEGGINGIWLMPLKRFMPSITIYYAPPDEDGIMQVLGNYLPLEEREHDMVDRLMRKVRF